MARRFLIRSLAAAAVAGLAVALRRIARPPAPLDAPLLPPPGGTVGETPAAPTTGEAVPPRPPRRGPTRTELYAEAKSLGIEGRSRMSKAQLQAAIEERRAGGRVHG